MMHSNYVMIDRLREQMEKMEMNARELAERAAVGRSFVYDILNGKSTNPTTRKLAAIAEVLGVSVSYLLYGSDVPANENIDILEPTIPNGHGIISIPAIAVEMTTGKNVLVSDGREGEAHFFRRSWIRDKLGASPSDLRIVSMHDDSMDPSLKKGDMVLIDMSNKMLTVSDIFSVFDGNTLAIRRLENAKKKNENNIRVISDNPQYKSYECDADAINIVGRVVWFAREL